MKRLYLILCLSLMFSTCRAQYVTIPDFNFASWLRDNGFGGCIVSGNQLDTTCGGILADSLVIDCSSSGIVDITGIQYFKGLINLNCSGNTLTFIPQLPPALQGLSCASNQISDILSLPPTLVSLDCGFNQIIKIGNLPENFSYLSCSYNQLDSLPYLPDGIGNLYCSYNNLAFLPKLPNSLHVLLCIGNQLTSLPALPGSLFEIDCSNNLLNAFPAMPSSLQQLECGYNELTSIPNLPDTMYDFQCQHNPLLTCLPELTNIRILDFDSTSVKCISNYGNVISSVPPLNSLPLCSANNPNGCIYTSIPEIKELSFSLRPNPASNYAQLVLNEAYRQSFIQVIDITGSTLIEAETSGSTYEMPINQLSAGLYFVRVSDGNGGVGVRKLVRE